MRHHLMPKFGGSTDKYEWYVMAHKDQWIFVAHLHTITPLM